MNRALSFNYRVLHSMRSENCYVLHRMRRSFINVSHRSAVTTEVSNVNFIATALCMYPTPLPLSRRISSMSSVRKRPDPITLTKSAADRIKELIYDKQDVVGVRISVKRRGCNGYSYTMNYADRTYMEETKDEKVVAHGVSVFVDPKAVFFLVGTQMDYTETALSSEFTFENPNSKGSCGCGESFNV
jgi:iron-sulfur cluster assembly accessory protein